jgi:hypothetical protein
VPGFDLKKIAYGVGGLLLFLLLVWFFVHGRSASTSGAVQTAAPAAVVAQGGDAASGAATTVAPASAPAAAKPAAIHGGTASGVGRGIWRVVAFTYNHESQAQQKVAVIAQKHPALRPEVFTPNGRAPYLVTVGGTMSRDEAFAMARKARGEGLPRDSYAQNYRPR